MSVESPIMTRREGRVFVITLNRPSLKNAINEDMIIALHRCLREVAKNSEVGVVALEGSGDAFCAGADIKNMAAGEVHSRKYSSEVLLRLGAECAMLLHEMSKPTIAIIRGPAMGAGLALALACDFRLADTSARLSYAHARIGLSGDFAAAYFLSKWMGAGKAREFCLLNQIFDAQQAMANSMLSQVCEAEMLEAEACKLARQLAEGPSIALGCIKDNLLRAETLTCDAYIQAEIANFSRCRNTDEHQEALKAFLEKRGPVYPRSELVETG